MPDKGDTKTSSSLPEAAQNPTKDANPKATDPASSKTAANLTTAASSTAKTPDTQSQKEPSSTQTAPKPRPDIPGPPFASLPPSSAREEFATLDPLTQAQVKQSDSVYETVLRYLDWNGKHPSPVPVFKPFYFFQQKGLAASGVYKPTASKKAASRWGQNASKVEGQALWIGEESEGKELVAWAEKQGAGGRLCPDILLVEGNRSTGKILLVG